MRSAWRSAIISLLRRSVCAVRTELAPFAVASSSGNTVRPGMLPKNDHKEHIIRKNTLKKQSSTESVNIGLQSTSDGHSFQINWTKASAKFNGN